MSSWENNIRRVEPYVPGEQPKEKNINELSLMFRENSLRKKIL